jgi:exodeoxyribonuclease V gamma subunit
MLPDYCRPDYLPALIDIFLKGQQTPEAFFVEASLAYIKHAHKLKTARSTAKPPLQAAIEQLSRAVAQPFEPELMRLYGNIDDMGQLLGDTFERQCITLLQPVWDAVHGN